MRKGRARKTPWDPKILGCEKFAELPTLLFGSRKCLKVRIILNVRDFLLNLTITGK